LALAILLTVLPPEAAQAKYQQFKFDVVARLPESDFEVVIDLDEWLKTGTVSPSVWVGFGTAEKETPDEKPQAESPGPEPGVGLPLTGEGERPTVADGDPALDSAGGRRDAGEGDNVRTPVDDKPTGTE
jgi:hypothetical protein